MPESDVTPHLQAAAEAEKSPLDKPLHQLTEDDISQLTREDCRRYLKQKGMRRPSWNKSQAIQQVISLKALLEPSPESDAGGANRRLYIPHSNNNNAVHVSKGTVADAEISESAEEARSRDPEKTNLSGDSPGHLAATVNNSAPSRFADSADILVGQMTIFYCGQVNVYDDVPADKVQAIMTLAGSPLHMPPDCLARHSTSHLDTGNVEVGQDSAVVFLPPTQTVKKGDNYRVHIEEQSSFCEDNPVEGSGSRKASVLRYLEKRKDRFKNKKKVVMTSSHRLDAYLKHQMQNHTANEHSDNRERIMEG